ncbi:MAG: phage tail protein, partial [bacterium]|nr:phage tail protein [bacterium]
GPEPSARLIKTPSGHLLHFEDMSGQERVNLKHNSGAELLIDEQGTLSLTDKNGATVTLDAAANTVSVADTNGNTIEMSASGTTVTDGNGNTIEMAAAGITVKGQQVVVEGQQVKLGGQGGEALIKGQSFLSLFMTHMHPHPFGPTGPPVPQGEMSSLSTKVTSS